MSKVSITSSKLDALANAISLKSGETVPLTLDEMVQAVDGIETGGGGSTLGTKSISANGTYNASSDNLDGYSQVTVAVPEETFVVTLSWDDNDDMWIPDKTFAEIQAAYSAGKEIVAVSDVYGDENVSSLYDDEAPVFLYAVGWFDLDSPVQHFKTQFYEYDGSGITPDVVTSYYYADDATISSNGQLLNGVKAVGSDGTVYTGNIPTKTSSDLTANGATVTVPSGYYASQATKQVASGTAGTPTATKGAVSNHSVSVTPSVTNTTGYITGSTKTGTAVTVSASELVSGTYTVDSSGTKDVTNYASASVQSGTAGTPSATKGTVSNHSVSVTPSVTNSTGWITGSTKTGTAVTVSASELVSGTYNVSSSGTADVTNYASISVPSLTLPSSTVTTTPSGTKKANISSAFDETRYLAIPAGYNSTAQYYQLNQIYLETLNVTQNGTYYPQDTAFSSVTVNVSGGGGGGSTAQVDTIDEQDYGNSSTITFTGLQGEPTSFALFADGSGISPSATAQIDSIVWDGTNFHAQTITNTSNAQVSYSNTGFSKSYSNGTLTVTSTNASFADFAYVLQYSYGGTSGNIYTEDVQVGSGATSITFTGLEAEPIYWSCIFKSNFSTSNGYQRVIFVRETTDNIYGHCMDSTTKDGNYWTSSYSNGSLTITSQGTNAGGYFHQPGYYQLTAVYETASPYEKVTKTYTPTTSQQTDTITPSTGYDAIDRVNVTIEAVPTMTLPSASSATSSGTSKATITPTSSAQYLNIPTGYNATAQYYTIAASGGGTSKNTQIIQATTRVQATALTKASGELTVSKTGTYHVYWSTLRTNTSSGYTWGSQLYVGGSAYGSENTSGWSNNVQNIHLQNVSLTANQKIQVYARGRSGSYYAYVPTLVIVEA